MTNQALVWLVSIPALVLFFCGLLDIYVSDGANAFLGLWMVGFGVWAMVRLYKVK